MPKKTMKKPTGAYREEMENFSRVFMDQTRVANREASEHDVEAEAAELTRQLDTPKSFQEHLKQFRALIATTGTNVDGCQ
jgi:hypothetical protein